MKKILLEKKIWAVVGQTGIPKFRNKIYKRLKKRDMKRMPLTQLMIM